MSANKWGVCPQCVARTTYDNIAMARKVVEAYGSVTQEKYAALSVQAYKMRHSEPEESMREYYEIGINSEGKFEVDYATSCDTCDFRFTYQFQQQIIVKVK